MSNRLVQLQTKDSIVQEDMDCFVNSLNSSFSAAKKYIANQATRSMFSLLKKARALLLPLVLQTELFQKTVKPTLLYGCEVRGFEDLKVLEQVQLKFLE